MARAKETFTNAIIERPVGKRMKYFDHRTKGLYVSVLPSGAATFALRVWNKEVRKQVTVRLGTYDAETFTVEHARIAATDLQLRAGPNGQLPKATPAPAGAGVTFAKLVDLYVDHISQPDPKKKAWGGARVESWSVVESLLKRPVKEFGPRLASSITDEDIAELLKTIGETEGSPAYANKIRVYLKSMYRWACDSGERRTTGVTTNPCLQLSKRYNYSSPPKDRVLSRAEIKTLWLGLDEANCPGDRVTRLALKAILVTMLRPGEVVSVETANLRDGMVVIPQALVKNRAGDFKQPLSPLAVEIINDALRGDEGRRYLFPGRSGGGHVTRGSLSKVLRHVIAHLGMKPFTPHDLRRTAATIAGELGYSSAIIARCLNHTTTQDSQQEKAPKVTFTYDRSKREIERLRVLEDVARAILAFVADEPLNAPLALPAPTRALEAAA